MNKKVTSLIICLSLFLTVLIPPQQANAYADLTEFHNYIENLDITYHDLSLTPEEIAVIEELQQNGGITYGMHKDDNTVVLIFEQISKVFGFDVTPVVYDDYATLLNDVALGNVDFTGSMIPTEERLQLFDFTTSTHKDKTFLFVQHEVFDLINTFDVETNKIIKVGYPTGFAIDGLLTDEFKSTFDYELIPINSVDIAADMIHAGTIDMVFGDISWYEELVAIENYMAIDYTEYIDTYFSGNLTKKGTNQELISAINKLYAETNALSELQTQIDNYFEDACLYALKVKYYDLVNHEKINQVLVSEYAPYVYKENGEYTGFFIDLFDEIFRAFDIQYKLVPAQYVDAETLSHEDFTVAMPIFVTEETQEKYNLTIPIAESKMSVITIPDDSSKYFTNVDDLGIQKVGTLSTPYMHNYINDTLLNSKDVTYYNDLEALTNALNSGEIKFGIVPYEEFNKYVIKNQIMNIEVLSSIHLPTYAISFGTPKTERGLKYEAILSSTLSILNYSDLENKYLSTTPEIQAVYQYQNELLSSINHMIIFSTLFSVSFLLALIYINQKRANTDYLTKLRNRRTNTHYIKTIKHKKNMSIAYIDLDNFKIINDVYGHHYGDEVLIYVAKELRKLSKHSRAFRVGGDEFVIIYNNKEIDFHKDIKEILDKTIKIEQTEIKVEGSVGNLNLEKYSHLDVEDIINLSDYAMMTAKRRGKNIVMEISDDLVNNYITIRDLRAALENEQYDETVKIYLESIKDNSQIYGFCLVAKCHHNNNFISYNELRIHMTNKLVLNKIGLLIFEKLCQSVNHTGKNPNAKMQYVYELETGSVNKQTIKSLADILAKYNINPRDITLRVDPSIFTSVKGKSYVELLNTLGCTLSMDFYKISGESLLYISYLDVSLLELDLTSLLDFIKHKDLSEPTALYEELSNNMAIKKIIELCNLFVVDLMLYTNDEDSVNIILDFLLEKITTKIYYVEKDNLVLLDDFLTNGQSI